MGIGWLKEGSELKCRFFCMPSPSVTSDNIIWMEVMVHNPWYAVDHLFWSSLHFVIWSKQNYFQWMLPLQVDSAPHATQEVSKIKISHVIEIYMYGKGKCSPSSSTISLSPTRDWRLNYTFQILAKLQVNGQVHAPAVLLPGKESQYLLGRRLGGSQSQYGLDEEVNNPQLS